MPIPHVFLPVKSNDFTVTPFRVHKRYSITDTDFSSSGYTAHEGIYSSKPTPISSSKAQNDPTNSFDGSFQHIIWQAINHRYYKNPYDSYGTFEHSNKRYTYKNLFLSASIFAAPYLDHGEGIKPGSVIITSGSITLYDDGNGNIYDSSDVSSSYANRHNVVAYWGFNGAYKPFRYGYGLKSKQNIKYTSNTFEPDTVSLSKNVYFNGGVNDDNGNHTGL